MDGYGKRLLLVEDDDNSRQLLSLLLVQARYNMHEVRDGVEALNELKKRRYDIVVTDYSLPRLNGLDLLLLSRFVRPGTPLVIVSGHQTGLAEIALKRGAYAWIRKPYDCDQLLQTIESATRQSSADLSGLMTSQIAR
jgi:two-component system chemotaxis response regulator CheY